MRVLFAVRKFKIGEYSMIRSMKQSDLDPVALIWLDTNIKAHDFIPASYWRDHLKRWGECLQRLKFMYGKKRVQEKFRALWDWTESILRGIFVQSQSWSQGIGGRLLDYIKSSIPDWLWGYMQKIPGLYVFIRGRASGFRWRKPMRWQGRRNMLCSGRINKKLTIWDLILIEKSSYSW